MSVKIKVIDSVDKKPLEGANLTLLDKDQIALPGFNGVGVVPDVVSTDAAGEAFIPGNPLIKFVKITYVGYADKIAPAVNSTVSLDSKAFQFGTAKVTSCRQYSEKNSDGVCEFSWKSFLLEHKLIAVFVLLVLGVIAFLLFNKNNS